MQKTHLDIFTLFIHKLQTNQKEIDKTQNFANQSLIYP